MKLRFKNIYFWSDNAGHFRSEELRHFIILELPSHGFITTQNFFIEYHGKSDIDGHFGLLQKVFNDYERTHNTKSIHYVLLCFLGYLLDASIDANFDIYDELVRLKYVKKMTLENSKQYMSLISNYGNIYGKSVSSFDADNYQKLNYKIKCNLENRKSQKAPKLKIKEIWKVSASKLKIMEKRVTLKT